MQKQNLKEVKCNYQNNITFPSNEACIIDRMVGPRPQGLGSLGGSKLHAEHCVWPKTSGEI